MPQYVFTRKNGQKITINAPEGMSQAEAEKRARAQLTAPAQQPGAEGADWGSFSKELAQKGIPSDIPEALGAGQMDPQTAAQVTGALGGAALSGGNPLGGAAGYALGDQLYKKYMGQRGGIEGLITGEKPYEITPSGALESFGTGLAYEVIPKAAIGGLKTVLPEALASKLPGLLQHGAGGLIPEGLSKRLAQSALKPGGSLRQADKLVETQLKKDLAVSRKGLAKASAEVSAKSKKVGVIAKEMTDAGETIDPKVMYESMESLKDTLKLSPPTSVTKDNIKHIDRMVAEWKKKYGTDPITPSKALEIKRRADNYLTGFWKKLAKTGVAPGSALDMELMEKGARGLRESLNTNPRIKELNKEISPLLDWMKAAEPRVVAQGGRGVIPFGAMETAGIVKGLGGGLTAPTAAIAGKSLLNVPSTSSRLANLLYRARTNQGGPITGPTANMMAAIIRSKQKREGEQ